MFFAKSNYKFIEENRKYCHLIDNGMFLKCMYINVKNNAHICFMRNVKSDLPIKNDLQNHAFVPDSNAHPVKARFGEDDIAQINPRVIHFMDRPDELQRMPPVQQITKYKSQNIQLLKTSTDLP